MYKMASWDQGLLSLALGSTTSIEKPYCLVARIGVIRFVRGDPSPSLRVTNRIKVRVTYCPLSG